MAMMTSSKSKSKQIPSPSGPKNAGYLLTCDPPTKHFVMHLNDQKKSDKKFIIEDLDATHLLIRGEAKDEITKRVDEWMDLVRVNPKQFLFFIRLYASVYTLFHRLLQ